MNFFRSGLLAPILALAVVVGACSNDASPDEMEEEEEVGEADGSPLDVINLWDNPVPILPTGSTVVFTGYSNSAQSANKFIAVYASGAGLSFVNCALGSNALENWVTKNLAADCNASNVSLTMNMIATQGGYDVDTFGPVIQSELPKLYNQLKAQFPNAIHAFYPGEPAHFVNPTKCPRICEPIRYLTGLEVKKAVDDLDVADAILGPYLHSGIGEPNASGIEFFCEDFNVESPGCGEGVANQHPSDSGREKVAFIYDRWLQGSGGY